MPGTDAFTLRRSQYHCQQKPRSSAYSSRPPLVPDSGLTGIQVEPIVLAKDDNNAAMNSVRCFIDAISTEGCLTSQIYTR